MHFRTLCLGSVCRFDFRETTCFGCPN
jgi:hypothetical protein